MAHDWELSAIVPATVAMRGRPCAASRARRSRADPGAAANSSSPATQKFFVKGVTYGPFGPGSHGTQFPEREIVARDFRADGARSAPTRVRVFTVPPVWLLDIAGGGGLGCWSAFPWSQHVTFLDEPGDPGARSCARSSRRCAACERHRGDLRLSHRQRDPARHGALARRRAGARLPQAARRRGARRSIPSGLVSYANFPSTEYLTIDFTDFLCFNVYLHNEDAFRRYLSRLHNLAVDRPLVLTEFGIDSMREGEDEQARILSWQVGTAFAMGVAGTFVFAWTDEWFTGGHLDRGLGVRPRRSRAQAEARLRRGAASAITGRCRRALPRYSARLGGGLRLQRRAHDGGVPRLARDAQLSRLRGHRRQ